MPKELNLSPNQRVDLVDFEYGTRTFTVDSLRAHVSRLLSGPYHGGFVLEGFRVIVPADLTTNEVTVTNGIAIDRTGRLITYEEGNLFLNNPKSTGTSTVQLLENALKNYVMVEFNLIDEDPEDRSFWDPTFANPPIQDSGGDNVPQPKGKEISLQIKTRKAQSWSTWVSGSGFEDSTDPNKIRIPIAIIPMDTVANSIALTLGNVTDPSFGDTEQANTTIIEKPAINDTTKGLGQLYCANTRIFDSTGRVEIYSATTGALREFNGGVTVLEYIGNDRQNNILTFDSSITTLNALPSSFPQIGDVIRFLDDGTAAGVSDWYLKDGSKYDCRPMFFSFTDDQASLEDVTSPFGPTGTESGDREQDTRNNRHWCGVSLMVDPSRPLTNESVNYPLVSYGQQKAVTIPARRVENRLKQSQDFFRALTTIMQEMKYGVASTISGTTTETSPATPGATTVLYALGFRTVTADLYIVDTATVFSQELVGSWVRFSTGANAVPTPTTATRRRVVEVIGEHVLKLDSAFSNPIAAGNAYTVEVNYPSNIEGALADEYVGGFVDTRYTGSLQEVWNGRVDQFTNSYSEDLNQRFSANKVATITVGDGISTHGDFTGGEGLLAAFKLAYAKKRGATIYIREGVYNVPVDRSGTPALGVPIEIGPNTTVVGEGKDRTIIKLLGGATTAFNERNYFRIKDYHGATSTPATSLISDITCSNITFKDLTIESADEMSNGDGTGVATWPVAGGYGYPLITNGQLTFYESPGTPGFGDPDTGVWRPNWDTTSNTASLVDNFTLDNVRLFGGGRGDYTTGNDVTYSVYLVSDEVNFTDYLNKNITFKDCTFDTHQGGTAILKSCENVLVEGCTFRNADPTNAAEPTSPLEGITFTSRSAITPTYQTGVLNCDGDVLINDCKFLGELYTEASSTTYPSNSLYGRAWINFTPRYLGQSVEVSSCIFRGDLLGDNLSDTSDPREIKRGSYKVGSGVLNCSPFDIAVTGCNFHTLRTGIISQIGYVSVTDCQFWNMYQGVALRPELSIDEVNYTIFSGAGAAVLGVGSLSNLWNWGSPGNPEYYGQTGIADKPETYTKLLVENCSVKSGRYGVLVGFYPNTPETLYGTHKLENSIKVLNCNFTGLWGGGVFFNFNKTDSIFADAYDSGNNIDYNWSSVEIGGCNFTDCTSASRSHGELKDLVNSHTAGTAVIRLPVDKFVYSNNIHTHCWYDGRSFLGGGEASRNAGAFTFVMGRSVVCKGNTFSNIYNENGTYSATPADAYEISPVMFAIVQSELDAVDNTWSNYQRAGRVATALQVGLGGAGYTWGSSKTGAMNLNISSNTITNGFNYEDPTTGVGNGVYVGHVFPEGDFLTSGTVKVGDGSGRMTAGPTTLQPNLTFKENDFELVNANFGLVAVQHDNGGYVGTATGGGFTDAGSVSNYWEWFNVNVSNNRININCVDMSAGGTVQYGNDIGTNLTTVPLTFNNTIGATPATTNRYSFLGASNVAQPAGYVACVDLRRVFRSFVAIQTDALDEQDTNVVSIVGNSFEVTGSPPYNNPSFAVAKSVQEVMGVRLSKFPAVLDIKDNTFTRAPLYIKWSWNNPFHDYSFPRMDAGGLCTGVGSLMTILGNTFFSENIATTVDINPATGFSHSAMSATSVAPYMNIDFSNNVVKGKTGASPGAANWETWNGAVRFWHPDAASWFQAASAVANNFAELAGGFHVHQDYLRFLWNVRNNDLTEIYFRVTQGDDGGYGAAAPYLASEFRRTTIHGALVDNNGLSVWDGNSLFVSTASRAPNTDITDLFGLDTASMVVGICPTYDQGYVAGGRDIIGDPAAAPGGGGATAVDQAMQEKCSNNWGVILSGTTPRNKRVFVQAGSQIGT